MEKRLRILILAPLKRPITFETTVSRNRVIVDLVTGLVKRGHKISILGTGDSNLPGMEIIPVIPQALNFMPSAENPFYQHTSYLTQEIMKAVARQGDFDIIHNHMNPEYLPLLSLNAFKIPMVTTVHSQMTEETVAALSRFPGAKLVAISNASQRSAGIPMVVIHNSVDTEFFVPVDNLP